MKQLSYLLLTTVLLVSCVNAKQYNDPVPEHDSLTIDSEKVGETRVINVWTPPGYQENETAYTVLYMPDGGIKEDFPHIANTLAKLIENNSIPPTILVGIENTERRRDLTGPSKIKKDEEVAPLSDGAKNFRVFISDELMPQINNKYRTNGKKGIIGESAAGLFVVETFLLKPETFDFYIAMDPALWWNDHYLVQQASKLMANFPNKETKLWFAGSDAADISPYTNDLAKTLKNNAPSQLTWKYTDEPNEKHNTIFRATKEKALTWSLNNLEKE
ncbi:alpha/beta hydrolase [Marixanthomonas spongiae]|uniref:Esterase n=1 Tax=Marixanthomonas spongiae TaxID=2174845 RepID=A0A2U0I2D0_9FLAO|nr:alpha/beta hydrolase-fold protein [Marixanthomonas spongiae]PVW15150.1 esterase [Marixanthomonas spongiae]